KVELIIGMHPHRIQGRVRKGTKYAYLCLGNFLFPNFYFKPPAELYYPDQIPEKVDVTFQYHRVSKLTYKKWKLKNRLSYVVEYDTISRKSKIIPMLQASKHPRVTELHGIKAHFVIWFFIFLSLIYCLPTKMYYCMHSVNKFVML